MYDFPVTMPNDSLLACPFCGQKPKLTSKDTYFQNAFTRVKTITAVAAIIRCDGWHRGIHSPFAMSTIDLARGYSYEKAKQRAVDTVSDDWNQRVPPNTEDTK